MKPIIVAGATAIVTLCGMAFGSTENRSHTEVRPADAAMIKQAIAAHRGQVVVVNFWATWCGPCVAEYPSLVKLQNAYRGDGLAVIAVSGDMKADRITKVEPFVVRQKANFEQFILTGDQQASIDAFDTKWDGSLPRTFIYDRHGRLVKELADQHTFAEFNTAVVPLLRR